MKAFPAASTVSYPGGGNGNNHFNKFDVISDYSDHHFVKSPTDCKTAHKRIMQEWELLKKNLPASIYVRVYRDRIDLLRAVIVGAAGTPFHDGLFFFDFAFPADYPAMPPKVHYRSYGLQISPNIYAHGNVFLSLINTFAGNNSESWDPAKSSVLQILLSIQARVLNAKPYFNRLIFPNSRGASSEKKSQAYNEKVFALSCRTMLHLNRNPPNNFEFFIFRHFCRRGSSILTACEAYVNGEAQIGQFGKSLSNIKVSLRFKLLMNELYPKLVFIFRMHGAVIDTSMEQLTIKKTTMTKFPPPFPAGEKKNGIAKKVITKIKKILGFKKKIYG